MPPIILNLNNKDFNKSLPHYTFKSIAKRLHWPKNQGAYLGPCGMWNFLWRLGFHPQELSIENLPTPLLHAPLFVDSNQKLDTLTSDKLNQWMSAGGKIIATGSLLSWEAYLPKDLKWRVTHFDNPYAGLACLFADNIPHLICPAQWEFIEYAGDQQAHHPRFIGHLACVQGERQTPARAHIIRQNRAPFIISENNFHYFNATPFAAFQAWLQGQEDLSPWLAWRHRLFWLDEWVSFIYDLMLKHEILEQNIRPGIKNLNQTTIILRHDLDYSRDNTFLLEENKRNIAGTYAILKDKNTSYWNQKLNEFPQQEKAFHYNTGKRNWWGLIRKLITQKSTISFLPDRKAILGTGLLKQLKWAKKQGIPAETIHRHLCYLIYPEWIDALDTVFESHLNVLGSSSLFRGQVLRWGTKRIDTNMTAVVDWPDVQFPLWYPFRVAHAGKGGKILPGWETTALMDPEPEFFTQMLDYKIKHLAQSIFTLIFHPAHANQASLYQNGTLSYFKEILDTLTERNIEILSMKHVLQLTNVALKEKAHG